MGNHLAWQAGHGKNILLGVDLIVGAHTSFSLPEDLRLYLEDLDICTLSQAHNSLSNARSYWYTADDLDLGDTFKQAWNVYRGFIMWRYSPLHAIGCSCMGL